MGNPYGPPPGPPPGQPPRQPGWPGPQPQPQPYGRPQRQRPPSGRRTDNDKNFFGALFDFTFDNFIAPKLVKFLYVIMLILITLGAIALVVFGLQNLNDAGIVYVIAAPIAWFIYLIVSRLYLELMIVMFKISDDLKDIRDTGAMHR